MFQKATNFLQKLEHNLSHKQGQDGWSIICGGLEGKDFEYVKTNYQLIGVRGKAGNYINKLQFLFVDAQTGQFQSTPQIGQHEGQDFSLQCPPGQWISKIYVWAGSLVDALQFETNSGMLSAKFGGIGGSKNVIDTKGKRICGVKGKSSEHINQICFGISK